jgi:voltage-gated potassium channel
VAVAGARGPRGDRGPLAGGDRGRYGILFAAIEVVAVAVFTIEYALRLWVAPEREPGATAHPWLARRAYARSAFGLIDLVAILPFVLGLLLPIHPDWLRVLRLCRLLKVARYVPALALFAAVLRSERRPLLGALLVMGIVLVLSSGVMFLLEREAQPTVFASIPHTMWWAMVTIATVGYGDIAPITAWGKVFGGLVMILGIAMFAVPAGILATGFAAEIRKRDFVVTWQTVAKVPLFAGLDAVRIAEITGLLRREVVPARYVIVRRGEPADKMFFVMAGELEADVQPAPRRLGPGQYFGEIALLYDTSRTATVTAVTECHLLALDVADFRRLLDAHPDLKAAISRVAERRLAATPTPEAGPPGPSP